METLTITLKAMVASTHAAPLRRFVAVFTIVLFHSDCPVMLQSHKPLVEGVIRLAQQVQADNELSGLIRRKFSIKCTTGYSLNALVDFPVSDPIEIIKRLMIGSEGTFGFVSRATYHTVPEWPHKVMAFQC